MKASNPPIEYRIQVKKSRSEGVKSYDSDNLYPQRVRELVRASGTASNCVNVYSKFIRGSGFKDKTFYSAKINSKGLTPDKLLRKQSKDFADWHGVAFLIRYNLLLEKVEVSYVPWEYCRLPSEDEVQYAGKVILYDDWDRQKRARVDTKKYEVIDLYTEDLVTIDAQIQNAGGFENWKGHVLWYSADEDEYPLAIYDPVLEDIRTDAGIKTYNLKGVVTNFLGSHMLELGYEFEDDKEREEFMDTIKTFQGVDNANKIMVVENKANSDSKPVTLTPIQAQETDKRFEHTSRSVKDSIIEAFTMPPILVGVQVSGKLGTAAELKDAYDFYNLMTSDERLVFEELYTKVFSNFATPINPSNDYSIIPLSYNIGGSDALISRFGIEGLNLLVTILSTSLAAANKINLVVLCFGVTREEADSMIESVIPETAIG